MLVIDPDECIDCGLCLPECAADAIITEDDDNGTKWLDLNTEYAQRWPVISAKGEVPADADDYKNVPDKLEKYFDPEPAVPMRKSA